LDSGFHAFRNMNADAGLFITIITRRERAIMEQIGAGHPTPLELKKAMSH
jgi:hypothetical protein